MNNKILILASIVALATTNVASAAESSMDLSEINLRASQTQIRENEQVNELLVASGAEQKSVIGEDASPLESSLENQDQRRPDENSGFLNIFNLKGGVEASANQPKLESEKTLVKEWLDGNYATGKWFGARPLLEEHGLTVNSSLLYSPFMKTGGGNAGEMSGKGYSLFNLSVSLDTEKAGLWKGGTFFTLYQKKTGYGISGPSGAMGDWMYLDGWDWRQMNQISECWYQQKLMGDKVRLKFGKQDANADFAYLNSGWDFINTAFSVNPTIPLPTYPDQAAVGFVAEFNPKEWLSIRNGIYSRYNTPFNVTEIEVKSHIKDLPGRYSIGAWEMSDSIGMSTVESISSTGNVNYYNFNRNFGAYAQFEQMVYKEKKGDENDMQGLVVFAQAGMSPSNKNDMSKYVGGGLHYTGLIPHRDQDKAGLAVGSGNFAARLGDISSQIGSETVIEAFYRFKVTPWFYFQPDVQFIMNPSGYYGNSVAVGLRSVITF